MWKVLVTESIHEEGLKILRDAADVTLVERVGISKEEFLAELADADALLTRSGTAIDVHVLESAPKLKVVARAGVGVDNVDLMEASKRGIVVINAPTGNTLSAADHTMALMLSLVRRVPQAHASILAGKWDRKSFMGHQLHAKKLFIIGLGKIGSQVAIRGRAFGMEVYAYDPYVPEVKMDNLGVARVDSLEDGLAIADVVTIHVPLTDETRGMLDENRIRTVKRGAYLINCARGGLMDEVACYNALKDGRLSGVAIDVYGHEPVSSDHPILSEDVRDRVVLTPHIGANTFEAQSAVARIAAQNLLAALRGEPYEHAVNLPFMKHRLSDLKKKFLALSRNLGILGTHMADLTKGAVKSCSLVLRGPVFQEEDEPIKFDAPFRLKPYTVAFLKGLLEVRHGAEVNYMIAPLIARDKGIDIEEGTGESNTYRNVIEVVITTEKGSVRLMGTVTEEGRQRVVRINDYWLDLIPSGKILLFQNHDRPGVIGKVGTLLGRANVNIANFALGRKNESGLALAAMQIDQDLSEDLLKTLREDVDLIWATTVSLKEDL
ncbi:D-3-phosphoglycerate dehydrogenase [Thermanaerovibrio velox DSM 12556]|uniref:D-3-phosphoglycerate dehydrogenase n=1 Tax=Thermanaerovibrio velox DSM 12556 TaxID=926567 RepID=H0URU9_9BACT|nr:phosphoglycerate dehydrogenase [Thermanaerovibrio velox]EHM10038.1 D-3-phosphoglycerate dehydrogenase [Thermanaerovibrio velox DSM 12556]